MTAGGEPGEETAPAAPLDRAKLTGYLETLTADREEAWSEMHRAKHRYDALTQAVSGLMQTLATLPPVEAEIHDTEETAGEQQ